MMKIWQFVVRLVRRIRLSVTVKTPIVDFSLALSHFRAALIGAAFL